jgi:hypothetical protein
MTWAVEDRVMRSAEETLIRRRLGQFRGQKCLGSFEKPSKWPKICIGT